MTQQNSNSMAGYGPALTKAFLCLLLALERDTKAKPLAPFISRLDELLTMPPDTPGRPSDEERPILEAINQAAWALYQEPGLK